MENAQPSFLDLLLEAHIGLERQGPGSPAVVRQALGFLGATDRFEQIADLGCGTGGQTLLLSEHLPGQITGLDLFPAFVERLNATAKERRLDDRVRGVVGHMEDLPFPKDYFDLIWSEGAIDNIGFQQGLAHWRGFLKQGGYVAVTCPSWFTETHPAEVAQFWEDAGSRLDSVETNVAILQSCGFAFVAAFALPPDCWTEHYYLPREKAIEKLLEKYAGCDTVNEYAALNRREVALFEQYHTHYGYVFYIGKAI